MNENSTISKAVVGWLFLVPAIVVFLLLKWLPMISTAGLSFVNWDILTPPKFAGFSNWMFLKDALFWKYALTTVKLTLIYLVPTICLGLMLGWALNRIGRGQGIFESCYLIPAIAGGIASAMIWRWIYNPDFGLANQFLSIFRFNGCEWLCNTRTALKAVSLSCIWFTLGIVTLFFYFVFRSSSEKRVIKWSILTVCLLGIINIITGGFSPGGPAGTTTTIFRYIYNNAYQWFKIGYACSISTVMMGILLILGIVFVRAIESNQIVIGYNKENSERPKVSNARSFSKIACYAILIIFGLYQVIPFIYAFLTALKEPAELFASPPRFIPSSFHWQNFSKAWNAVPFGRFYIVSVLRAVFIVIPQVTIAFLAAYSLSVLKPRGSRFIFWGIFSTIFIAPAIEIPIFIQIRLLHWIDTWKALVLPYMACAGAILIFKMYLDGLSNTIALRLNTAISHSKRMIALVSFISFTLSWTEIKWPSIVTNSMKMKTVSTGLASFQGLFTTDWTLLMAGVCIQVLPVIALFLLLRKYLLKGIYIISLNETEKS